MDPGDDVRKGRLTLVVQRSRARVLGGKGGAPRRVSQDERRIARNDPFISRPKPLPLTLLVGRRADVGAGVNPTLSAGEVAVLAGSELARRRQGPAAGVAVGS